MSDTSMPSYPIPGRLNLLLLCIASAASVAALWAASHAEHTAVRVLAVVCFSFTNNTLFALLHEAVHGVLHPQPTVNRWAGRWAAAFFPTSFSLQRGFHLVHHRNNRSPRERFDYVQPGESRLLKQLQWYGILTGVYWLGSVLALLLYLVVPPRAFRRWAPVSPLARQTAAAEYGAVLAQVPGAGARLELLGSLAVQAALFVGLALDPGWWAACYGAFALNWSTLQYADHAFSPLDPRDGAWNLRVSTPVRALFLNYHYHLAHHRHPKVPWRYLGRLVDPSEPQPSYLRIWLQMWRGPRPLHVHAGGREAHTGEHASEKTAAETA